MTEQKREVRDLVSEKPLTTQKRMAFIDETEERLVHYEPATQGRGGGKEDVGEVAENKDNISHYSAAFLCWSLLTTPRCMGLPVVVWGRIRALCEGRIEMMGGLRVSVFDAPGDWVRVSQNDPAFRRGLLDRVYPNSSEMVAA